MDEREWLAQEFEEQRPRLRAVAYRMLGSLSEADDAVQEAWLRLSRADAEEVENLGAWLTTVVGPRGAEHAARPQVAARGAVRPAPARADRRPRRRHRPRARGAAGRLGGAGAARRARHAAARRSGSRSCCTTCSPCRSTRSRRSWTARPRRRGSWPAGRGAGCRASASCPTPASTSSARSSRPSSPRRTTATSTGSSPSSIPTWCCAPTWATCPSVCRASSAAPRPWPGEALVYRRLDLEMHPVLVNGAAGHPGHPPGAAVQPQQHHGARRAHRDDGVPGRPGAAGAHGPARPRRPLALARGPSRCTFGGVHRVVVIGGGFGGLQAASHWQARRWRSRWSTGATSTSSSR